MDTNKLGESPMTRKTPWTKPVIKVILINSARLGTLTTHDGTGGNKS
jgi:hypothetical protein